MIIESGKHAERLILMLEGMIDNYIDDDNRHCPNAEDCRGAISLLSNSPRDIELLGSPQMIHPSSMEKKMLEIAQEQVDEYYGKTEADNTRSTTKGDTPPSKQGE